MSHGPHSLECCPPVARARAPQSDFSRRASPRRGSRADVADGAASAAPRPRSVSPLYVAAGGGAAVAYRRQSPRRSEQRIVRDGEYFAPSWLNP